MKYVIYIYITEYIQKSFYVLKATEFKDILLKAEAESRYRYKESLWVVSR